MTMPGSNPMLSPLRWIRLALCAAMLAAVSATARASGEVTVSATPQRSSAHPGAQLAIAVEFAFEDGWHIWPSKPVPPEGYGDAGVTATTIEPTGDEPLPAGVRVVTAATQWPQPQLVPFPNLAGGDAETVDGLAYAGRVIAYVPVVLPGDLKPGPLNIRLKVEYQACNESTCLRPASETISVPIMVVAPDQPEQAAPVALFANFDPSVFARILSGEIAQDSVGKSITFDFLGYTFTLSATAYVAIFLISFVAGLLMNFTPCVLPVIPIKILSLQNQAKQPTRLFAFGFSYCCGIVAVFAAIGVLAFTVGLSFGQWFSLWYVTIPLAVFIFVMGLGMMGLFTIRLPNWIYNIDAGHETMSGNFMMGILTGVLSTPCTGPMFAVAFAWATNEPPLIGMAAIITMGLGMAAPYLLLIIFPKLIDRLPRGGAGGELLKQVLGLFMMGVAAYIGTNVIADRWPFWIVGGLVGLGFIWWAVGAVKYLKRPVFKSLNVAVAVIGLALTGWITVLLTHEGDWRVIPNQTDDELRRVIERTVKDEGRPIILDFTAKWCTNCLAIERLVLSTDAARSTYAKYNARLVKVDLTLEDAGGWGIVKSVLGGGGSIPLIAFYGPKTGPERPEFFASFFKVSDLEAALAKVADPVPTDSK